MIRKIGFLLLFILLVSAVCVQAEDVKIKSHGRVRVKAKNARLAGREENVAEAHPDLKTTAEFQEIDDLSKDIRQTLTSLQKDIEKILAGIRSVAMRKSTIEAVYRRKDSEFKTLSAKLNELGIKRKGLSEFRTVAGSFNNVDADSIAVNLSANNDDVTSLHKRIDDVLSGATAAKAVEEKRADVRVTSDSLTGLNSMPKWILDKIREKGKKMETSYGDMVVVKEGGTTIISIKKENDAKFRGAYEKFIKESYEGDGMEYFVLAAGS
ncbi:MAG: hypothetical protein ABSB95_08935 [Dissulfurispiraceae bacterium]